MSEHNFCRALLAKTLKQVRKRVDLSDIKKAWAYKDGFGGFEFHGPNGFYAHGLNADCLWSAKAEGWAKYLDTQTGEENEI